MSKDYGLTDSVKFCKKCVMPNTRPSSCNEYEHFSSREHDYIEFDENGVCSACNFNEKKWDGTIDWEAREKELLKLLDQYRSKDGSYDCLVPGSGGKDSIYASHVLKYKYNMNPLTVTWAPHLYTSVGFKNFQNWLHVGGFDNYLFTPNGKLHRKMTREAFLNLLHPFQPFILGQKTYAVKMAAKLDIPLIFYGESPGEFGANLSIDRKGFTAGEDSEEEQLDGFKLDMVDPSVDLDSIGLGGKPVKEYLNEGFKMGELEPYLPLNPEVAKRKNIQFQYLGYYLKWVPQECYYYSVEHTDFEANPERTEGTYSKYNSIDDKTDGYFYYTTYMKFGYGRATQDSAQEVRNHHIDRDEAVALVKKYDGELPKKYFKEFLDYIEVDEKEFHATCDKFRSPKLWEKVDGQWKLKHAVYDQEL